MHVAIYHPCVVRAFRNCLCENAVCVGKNADELVFSSISIKDCYHDGGNAAGPAVALPR